MIQRYYNVNHDNAENMSSMQRCNFTFNKNYSKEIIAIMSLFCTDMVSF